MRIYPKICVNLLPSYFYNTAVRRNNSHFKRNILTACFYRTFYRILHTAAARHCHSCEGNTLYIVITEYLCQLFGVINSIELRTADERDLPTDKIMVEVSVGVSCAIGSDKQISTVEVGGISRQEIYLYGELSQKLSRMSFALPFTIAIAPS